MAAAGGTTAVIALTAAAGGVTVAAETATVQIVAPAQQVEMVVNLDTVPVRHIEARVTDTSSATASTAQVAATYATGFVTLTWLASPNPSVYCTPVIPVDTIVAAPGGLYYAIQESIMLGYQATVPIRAIFPGKKFNQGPGAIQKVLLMGYAAACNISATNSSAITGGGDAYTVPVLRQSDLDAAQAALESKITPELQAGLTAKVAGMTFVEDGSPVFTVTADHAVGEKTPAFTLTATGVLGANAFTDAEADQALRAALQRRVLPGYKLRDPIQEQFVFRARSQPGQPAVWGHGVGFAVPAVSASSIAKQLAGMPLSDAVSRLESEFPGSSIVITAGPMPTQWLPVQADRIRVAVTAGPAGP